MILARNKFLYKQGDCSVKKIYHIIIFSIIITLLIILYTHKTKRIEPIECTPKSENTSINSPIKASLDSPTYTAKKFNLAGKLQGLSKEQITQHQTLYEGYVKRRNEIANSLQHTDRSGQNRTYSVFRELKIEESYAVNGSILHELYFENLGIEKTTPGNEMLKLIEKSFGSLENFKSDLMDCALCSRGWVITAYSIDDKRIHNFVCDQHNQNVPILIMPLIVLDMYEHAYMIDFGIKQNPYLEVFWNHIQWNVIEDRVNKWVKPFMQ